LIGWSWAYEFCDFWFEKLVRIAIIRPLSTLLKMEIRQTFDSEYILNQFIHSPSTIPGSKYHIKFITNDKFLFTSDSKVVILSRIIYEIEHKILIMWKLNKFIFKIYSFLIDYLTEMSASIENWSSISAKLMPPTSYSV